MTTGYTIRAVKSPLMQLLDQGCAHERFKNDLPELHTEFDRIIKEKNDSLLAFIMPNYPPPPRQFILHTHYNYSAHINYSYITPS